MQNLLDSTNLKTHSSIVPNGEVTIAHSLSKNQETQPSSNTEALAKPPSSEELDGATAGLSPGKRQSFN